MTTVVSIEGLWKEYRLGVIGYGTLTHDLQSWYARLRGRDDPNRKISVIQGQEKQIEGSRFWALRDINLKIEKGEVLGIIGKNGAGKSTLLKVLSRVTAPSRGKIKVKGRIASLLEVGTGFHPELTGRENIFLNGAILGMSKSEIGSKLDEIIDFSGVEDFIDTPVKRYSSGMNVRLAFAVAAHLEPEILVIDEVLAVGDAEFQKKCLGKMGEVATEGRTVLFVSHNLTMINRLCSRCILIEGGELTMSGHSNYLVQKYIEETTYDVVNNLKMIKDRKGAGGIIFSKIQLLDQQLNELTVAKTGEKTHFRIFFENTSGKTYRNVRFSLLIKSMDNGLILLDSSLTQDEPIIVDKDGYAGFTIERLPLSAGKYATTMFVEAHEGIQDWIQGGPSFTIEGGDYYKTGKNCVPGFESKLVLVDHTFSLLFDNDC